MRYVCLVVLIFPCVMRAQDKPLTAQQIIEANYADLRGQAVLEGREDSFGIPKKLIRPGDGARAASNPITFARPTELGPEATSVAVLQHKVTKDAVKANDRGLKFAEKLDHAKAMAEFANAVALDPEFADAHSNLGTAYFLQGRIEESAREFRRAVELNPAFAIAYTNLASAEFALGDTAGAAAHVRRGIALGDTSAIAQNVLNLTTH